MEKNGFNALKADQLSAAVNKTEDYFHNSMFGATTNASQEHGEVSRYNSMRKCINFVKFNSIINFR